MRSTPGFNHTDDISVPGVLSLHSLSALCTFDWSPPSGTLGQYLLLSNVPKFLCTPSISFPGGPRALYCVWAHPRSFVYRQGLSLLALVPVPLCFLCLLIP